MNRTPLMNPALGSAEPLQDVLQAVNAQFSHSLKDGAHPGLPAVVLMRLETAQATAQKNVDAFNSGARARHQQMAKSFAGLQSRRRKKHDALKKLRELAAEFSGAAKPYSACKRQCTHCCHIPVALYASEARVMGKALGREPRAVEHQLLPSQRPYGYEHPCPFLAEGKCSIYEHRPLACRLHLNMDEDELLCRLIPGDTVPVPLANTTSFYVLYARLCEGDALADIRDYFPAPSESA